MRKREKGRNIEKEKDDGEISQEREKEKRKKGRQRTKEWPTNGQTERRERGRN